MQGKELSPTATSEAMRLMAAGIAAARRGRREQARGPLRRASELEPKSESVWLWLATVEEPMNALRCLERVLSINPGNDRALASLAEARLKAGIAAARAGNRDEARTLLLAVIARDPDNLTARLWLASLARTPTESLTHARHVLTLDPSHEQALEIERVCLGRLDPDEVDYGGVASSPRILVVDDSPTVREFVRLTLERYGCEVMTATDGAVALQLMAECGTPHLAFFDTTLPPPDGFELAERLHQWPGSAEVPVVLLTRAGASIDPDRWARAAAVEQIRKPFAPEQILEAVQRYAPGWA